MCIVEHEQIYVQIDEHEQVYVNCKLMGLHGLRKNEMKIFYGRKQKKSTCYMSSLAVLIV